MSHESHLLADEQVDGNTTEGETLWGLGDQLSSILDLVSYDDIAEDTGIRKHTGYDSYGRVTGEEYYGKSESPIAREAHQIARRPINQRRERTPSPSGRGPW